MANDAIGYVDFGIVGKLDAETTDSLRYFAQCLFAGHVGRAVDEFMRFLTPSRKTNLNAARHDLIEALKSYLESERVSPGRAKLSENIFEIEMLALVRQHAMTLAPDAVRYLKAVLTAESMVRELDPAFDLRAHENRFFARLTQMEITETLSPGRATRWLLDLGFRLSRLLESAELARDDARTPRNGGPAGAAASSDVIGDHDPRLGDGPERAFYPPARLGLPGLGYSFARIAVCRRRDQPALDGVSHRPGTLVAEGLRGSPAHPIPAAHALIAPSGSVTHAAAWRLRFGAPPRRLVRRARNTTTASSGARDST